MSSTHPSAEDISGHAEADETPFPPPKIAWYTVAILLAVFVFSFLDRQIINLLVTPIKAEFGINDTMMGVLMGPTFAIFYSLFGLPFGSLADKGKRTWIVAGGLAFWTLATAGCGMAKVYWQLLLARMGVGVGQAALAPAAYSMMSDLFPREKLPFAMSIYGTGISIGAGLAVVIGGIFMKVLGELESIDLWVFGSVSPWQSVFIVLGVLGFIPLIALMLTIREPARRGYADGGNSVPIGEVLGFLRANARTFVPHHLGLGVIALSSYGVGSWLLEFFMRKHGWSEAQVGLSIGMNTAITGTIGGIAGGLYASRLHAKGIRNANMRVSLISILAPLPLALTYPLIPDGRIAFLCLIPTTFFVFFPIGALGASIQEMVPASMRARASAIYIFFVNIIGMGLGPPLVGAMTDYVFRDEAKLGYSMILTSGTMHAIGAFLIWRCLRNYTQTLDNAANWGRD